MHNKDSYWGPLFLRQRVNFSKTAIPTRNNNKKKRCWLLIEPFSARDEAKNNANPRRTFRLSPSGDDASDVGRDAPMRQADGMNVAVECEMTAEPKQRQVRVLASWIVRRMNDHLRYSQRLTSWIWRLHDTRPHRCSLKKEVWGRLKQDLDKDFKTI